MSEIVYLSLGSNLGNREGYLQKATEQLSQTRGLRFLAQSSLYHSMPVDCQVGCPEFMNKVLQLESTLDPEQLLAIAEQLERDLGRTQKGFNVDRVIDIDIILFGDRIFRNERLEIPHPRMSQRAFVLIPLCEIAPDLRDPRSGELFCDLLKSIGVQGVIKDKAQAGV
jgi:2-amino-4-hydroxy-6-hydroxymethyldihydropteridine diphosphokinase